MCGQYNFTNFKARFLHIKAHLLHFLRKDLKYHHKEKNEIKTDLKIIVFCKLNEWSKQLNTYQNTFILAKIFHKQYLTKQLV